MGSKHAYAARYYLSMKQPELQVVSLSDPKSRAEAYRGLHPGDFSALLFLDDGASPWPPTSQQQVWLRQNLQCQASDPLDGFLDAVWARSGERSDGFYPLSGPGFGHVGPGQIWVAPPAEGGLCAP